MNKKTYIIIILLLSLGLKIYSQSESKPFNETLVFSINNDSISGYALIAKGNELKETIILLHGLPGNEKNLDIAETLRQSGKNVIYFNYRGSWGSQGEFLYSNCIEDISKVMDYLSNELLAKKLRIRKGSFSLIGHSLGGGIAILHGIKDDRVKKIIAISTFNTGKEFKFNKSIDELKGFQQYLDKQFMLNINSKIFINEILNHKKEWDLTIINSYNVNKSLLFIDENNRNEKWIKKIQNKKYIIIESDHSFSDKRKKLGIEILKWLNKN